MKRVPILFVCLIALAAFAFQVPGAGAFPQYSQNRDATNCRTCHGDFRAANYTGLTDGQSWGNLHDLHRNTMLNMDCNTCHVTGSFFPVSLDTSTGGTGLQPISCVGCHGRAEDAGNDNVSGGLGAGLRQHHWSAGITTCGAAGCHTDANPATTTLAGEDVLPPYYANPGTGHPNMPTNPCNTDGSEDFAGSAEGLDNDGDNLYDGDDPDCQQAPEPAIGVAPPSRDFGNVALGGSASQVFTISNGGTDNLVVSGMTLSDTANFGLDNTGGPNPCGSETPTIAGADNCTVVVTFNPQSLTTFSETLSITSNDPDNTVVTVPLTGTGVAAAPDVAVSPESIDFGSVNVGAPSTREVTIANAGTDVLNVSGIILSDNTAIYTLDLGGGANPCVTATPLAMEATLDGPQADTASAGTGTADIQYNPATNLLSWDIDYSGLTGPLTVAHFHGPAPPGVSAGVQVPIAVSDSPLTGSATITVEQEADLLAGLYYVNLHTAANPDGEIRGQVTVPFTIPADDNCTVAVTFTPPAAGGPFPAALAVLSDDSDTPSASVPITGSGRTPSRGGGGGCAVIGRSEGAPGGIAPYVLLALAGLRLAFRRRSRSKGRG